MRITVVGDVLLDVDLTGEATRLCPDAPVPVVDIGTTDGGQAAPGWWPGCWPRTGIASRS